MNPPQLSILLPYRNAQPTLASCLDSIFEQSFRNYELLAINDHSTDRSRDIVEHFARKDPRIRMLDADAAGLIPALNQGLASARTDLVARMDADDWMHPERLERQYRHMRARPHVTVLGSRVAYAGDVPITDGFREYLRWQNACVEPAQIAGDIYLEAPFAHPSVMLRRERIIAAGGYRDGPFPEDYELWLRLARRGEHMEKLAETLLHWRDSPNRFSRTDARYDRDAFDRLRADYLANDLRIANGERPLVFWGAGRRTRLRARTLIALGPRPSAWIDVDRRKIGNRIDGVPVLSPDWLRREQRPFVLCYVASHGARERIERHLADCGYIKGRDFLQVG